MVGLIWLLLLGIGVAYALAPEARPRTGPRQASVIRQGDTYLVHYRWPHGGREWEASWHVSVEWLIATERELAELPEVVLENLDRQGIDRDHPDLGLWFWRRAWRRIAALNLDRIDEVVETFRTFKEENGLDDAEIKLLALQFVQSLPYATPEGELGVYAPPQTLVRALGDCDTKSLLYLLILRKLGYDAIMLYSPHYQHAMVGIGASSPGTFIELDGQRYYFCETTQLGFWIGEVSPSVGDLARWIPLRIL